MSDLGNTTSKPLIESDRVEGTTVYDREGNNIGSIKRLMIEKLSGQVAYAVISFGGFLGMGSERAHDSMEQAELRHKLRWLSNGHREEQLRDAPTFYRDQNWDWSDRNREQELHDYYRAPYYWG
jgi:PRC-barrel domain